MASGINALDQVEALAEAIAIDIAHLKKDAQNSSLILSLQQKLDAVLITAPSVISATTNVYSSAATSVAATEDIDYRNLRGMCNKTGKLISGAEYLKQRLTDAIYTPLSSLPLLRTRGSALSSLIDAPLNVAFTAKLINTIADAINHKQSGVPDFSLSQIELNAATSAMSGQLSYILRGKWRGTVTEVTV